MAASLSQKIRELKDLADEGELDRDDLKSIERIDELTGNGGAATSGGSTRLDIHGRPRFAKQSFDGDKKVKIAAIHPDFE